MSPDHDPRPSHPRPSLTPHMREDVVFEALLDPEKVAGQSAPENISARWSRKLA